MQLQPEPPPPKQSELAEIVHPLDIGIWLKPRTHKQLLATLRWQGLPLLVDALGKA